MLRAPLTKRALLGHAMVPFFTALYLILFPIDTPMHFEDSASYLNFSPVHSLGYPLFLEFIKQVSDDSYYILSAQVILFAFAIYYLSLSIRKISGYNGLSLLVIIPICINPFVLPYHFIIQPHSLFITISLFMTAFFISAFGRAHIGNLLGIGLSIGLAIIILPFGWAYVPLILFATPLLGKQSTCSYGKAFLLPFLISFALTFLENSTYANLHQEEKQSHVASHIYAKTVAMDTQQPSPYAIQDPRTHIWQLIEETLKPTRQKIWSTVNFRERERLLTQHEEDVRTNFAIKEFNFAQTVLAERIDEIQLDIATSRIIQDPMAYLEIGFQHYRAQWDNNDGMIFVFWAYSLIIVVISLWYILMGAAFNSFYAASFISALTVQILTLWIAFSGFDQDEIIIMFSPLLTLSLTCMILGFYVVYINPIHTHD